MFKEAARRAMWVQGRRYKWLVEKTDIPMSSILAFLGNTKKTLKPARIEKIFEVLGITLNIPEE